MAIYSGFSKNVSSQGFDLEKIILINAEGMPRRMRDAARYIIDNPSDFLFCSMREVARRAKVAHTTMMRLAHWLGYDSYEELQSRCRSGEVAEAMGQSEISRHPDVDDIIASLAAQAARLTQGQRFPSAFMEASQILAHAPRVFCLGLSSQYAVAHQFNYALRHIGKPTVLLSDAWGMATEYLREADSSDALMVVSTAPHLRATIDVVREAAQRHVKIVAITDDRLSPLVRLASATILVSLPKHYYFQTIAPVSAAAEILAGLVARISNVQPGNPAELTINRFGRASFYPSEIAPKR